MKGKCFDNTSVMIADVLILSKKYYESSRNIGICKCIGWAITDYLGPYYAKKQVLEITLFSRNIALSKFNAINTNSPFWWNLDNRKDRINYLDWMIKEYL